jgi:hypothetical protein
MAAQAFTNFGGSGVTGQPTSFCASDGFVGNPNVGGLNPNNPSFGPALFPYGANVTGGVGYTTAANTSGFTATAAEIYSGSFETILALTGTLAGAANLTLPTVASLVAAISNPQVGQTYTLRIINESAGAFAWTVVTDTGWTLNGTMSIAQDTWRDFLVTLTSLTAATLQNLGTGTFS